MNRAASDRRVRVTHHALERWRERVHDGWADEKWDVEESCLKAAPVGPAEPLPFPRDRTKLYYRHASRPDLFFVCRTDPSGCEVLVTVMFPKALSVEKV